MSRSYSTKATTISKPCQVRQLSNGSRIRKNLFLKLGVQDGEPETISREPSRGSLLGKVTTSLVPLKDPDEEKEEDAEADDSSSREGIHIWGISSLFERRELTGTDRTLSSSFSSSEVSTPDAGPRATRKLTFNKQVLVCPIPKHEAYSKRIKDSLWIPPEDAARNVERNAIEYASEGWKVGGVLDDEDMYLDPVTGEKIHPIHVELWRAQTGMDCTTLFAPGIDQRYLHTH